MFFSFLVVRGIAVDPATNGIPLRRGYRNPFVRRGADKNLADCTFVCGHFGVIAQRDIAPWHDIAMARNAFLLQHWINFGGKGGSGCTTGNFGTLFFGASYGNNCEQGDK